MQSGRKTLSSPKMISSSLFSTMLSILLLLFLFGKCNSEMDFRIRTCEPIRIDACSNVGYYVTGMPNFAGHDMQQDADLQIQTYTPLIQYGCSSRLQFFLCSVYAPMCTEKVNQPIGPCRPLCESVKKLCEPVLVEFGFKWPKDLNCSQFAPANNHKHMCMEGPEKEEQTHVPIPHRPSKTGIQRGSGKSVSRPSSRYPIRVTKVVPRSLCKHLRMAERYYYLNNTKRCAAACHADILYSKGNKDFAQLWIAVWSGISCLSTLFTIFVYFSRPEQFRYPEKIIVFLGWCYFIVSIAHFIRLVGGREDVACYNDTHFQEPLLIQGGLDNVNCTIIFTLVYYFGMASMVWWVLLTMCWFLTAGLNWNIEFLEQYNTYFHFVAWILPAIKTFAILVMRNVDADELTGMCFVGTQDPQAMLRFVIIPSVTYFSLGIIFLFSGLFVIIKNKLCCSKLINREDKWESLMARTGIFAILYTIPGVCVLSANIYEYMTKDLWLSANSTDRPNVEIFTLKIFMSLVVGITTGLWLYTWKTPQFNRINFNKFTSKLCPKREDPIPNPQSQVLLMSRVEAKVTIV